MYIQGIKACFMKYDNKKNTKVLICGYFTPLLKVKVRVTHRSWVNIDLWNQSRHSCAKFGIFKIWPKNKSARVCVICVIKERGST